MNSTKNLQPVLCMPRDMQIIAETNERLTNGEPTVILGLKGCGKDIIFESLVSQYPSSAHYHLTGKDELDSLIVGDNLATEPLVILNLSIEEDCPELLEWLSKLKTVHSSEMNVVVICNLAPVRKSLAIMPAILKRSLLIIPMADQTDLQILGADFSQRFDYTPSPEILATLTAFSGGHIGLFKSIFLAAKACIPLDIGILIRDMGVAARLDMLFDDLSLKLLDKPDSLPEFFEMIGFTSNGKFFSPLITEYLPLYKQSKNMQLNHTSIESLLSPTEILVFRELQSHPNNIVTREKVAQIIWGQDTEDKYSDWAIDKLISRLRQKINASSEDYILNTKKGLGFILAAK